MAGLWEHLVDALADHGPVGQTEGLDQARADHQRLQPPVAHGHGERRFLNQQAHLLLATHGLVTSLREFGDVLRNALQGVDADRPGLGVIGGPPDGPAAVLGAHLVFERLGDAGGDADLEGRAHGLDFIGIADGVELIARTHLIVRIAGDREDVGRPLHPLALRLVAPGSDSGRLRDQKIGSPRLFQVVQAALLFGHVPHHRHDPSARNAGGNPVQPAPLT